MKTQEQPSVSEQFRKMLPAEKFEVLLSSVQTLDQAILDNATKINALIETVSLLYKQNQALMALLNISQEQINNAVEQMEAMELKGKLDELKEKGILSAEESDEVKETSFVVLRVVKDGKVHSHRAQAPVKLMSQELKSALLGKKKGDAAENGGLVYEVIEIYEILEKEEKQDSNNPQ